MQFSRRDIGFLFLLIWMLAACAPGVSPNSAPQTGPGVTPNIASGTATIRAPGGTPNAGSGAATVTASKVAPGTVTGTAPATALDPAPAQALERYLGALTSKNESVYTQSICKDWENQAFLEFDAYQGLELDLKGLACRVTANEAGEAQATCQGKILLNYGNERQEVDLSKRNYRLTFRNDQWQVCGFSE